ncbi:MAG: DUF2188 domain-containing protein [bacterium]
MTRKVVHVTSRNEGKWAVKIQRSQRAFGVYENKPEAIQVAKHIAKNAPLGQVIVHKRGGKIQTEYTYRKDPEKYPG